ncbi:MAG: hypothetical protein LBP26_08085 [Clostridiales bacterium]|jgi:hypothetical protein|nr:hypothetical protein [Clostridiales bacterium]
MSKAVTKKLHFALAFLLCLLCCLAAAGGAALFASADFDATDYPRGDGLKYFYFTQPKDIYVYNNKLYVLDKTAATNGLKIKVFPKFPSTDDRYELSVADNHIDQSKVNGGAPSFHVYGGTVFTVAANNYIYAYEDKAGGALLGTSDPLVYSSAVSADTSMLLAAAAQENGGGYVFNQIRAVTITSSPSYKLTGQPALNLGDLAIPSAQRITADIECLALKEFNSPTSYTLFAATKNSNQYNIHRITNTNGVATISTVKPQISGVKNIVKLNDKDGKGRFICLQNNSELTIYKEADDGSYKTDESVSVTGRTFMAMSVSGDFVYVLNDDNSVSRFDLNNFNKESETVLMASAANADGFYNDPMDVVTRNGKMYVADYGNNRVATHGDGGYGELVPAARPVTVAVDGSGKTYAAISGKDIFEFAADGDGKWQSVWTVDYTVEDLKIDSKNNFYLLASDNKLYACKLLTLEDGTKQSELTPAYGGGEVYAVDTNVSTRYTYVLAKTYQADGATVKNNREVVRLDGNGEAKYTNIAGDDITDIAVDADNGIYVLKSNNNLTRYDYDKTADSWSLYQNPGSDVVADCAELTKITVSAIDNKAVKYRDILAIDNPRHAVKIISRAKFGFDESVLPQNNKPDIAAQPDRPAESGGIIRTVIGDGARVYSIPSEIYGGIDELKNGLKVIVPDYDPDSAFSLVIADNVPTVGADGGGGLIVGYVNNAFLSAPIDYDKPPEESCDAWTDGTTVYKYPSRQSPALADFGSVGKGVTFEFLDFVHTTVDGERAYGYVDNFPDTTVSRYSKRWYRVKVEKDGGAVEGYVMSNTVSILGANPDFGVYPQNNAEIIAKDKNYPDLGAYIYTLKDGAFDVDNRYAPLIVGTKVEVAERFDSSRPYTKIRFLTRYGMVEAYVETANLRYYGVNAVQVVAVALITVTLMLMIFICVRMYYVRRRKLLAADR